MEKTIKKVLCTLLVIGILFTTSFTAFAATAGDVNSDGKVNSTDALCILKHSVSQTPSNFNKSAADVNSDGKINSTDALIVLKISVGMTDQTMSKDEIVKLYNDSIKKSYEQNKCVLRISSDIVDITVNKLLFDGEENPEVTDILEDVLSGTEYEDEKYTFYKGKTLRGEKAEDILFSVVLEASKVKTATAVKYGDGYKITIQLHPGTETVYGEDVSNAVFPAFEDMTLAWTNHEITAVTDAKGRIVSINEHILGNVKTATTPDEEDISIYMDIDMDVVKDLSFSYQ